MLTKASLVSFTPEDVDVDWIVSETDNYGWWFERKPCTSILDYRNKSQ